MGGDLSVDLLLLDGLLGDRGGDLVPVDLLDDLLLVGLLGDRGGDLLLLLYLRGEGEGCDEGRARDCTGNGLAGTSSAPEGVTLARALAVALMEG